jgi:hypothetical protein
MVLHVLRHDSTALVEMAFDHSFISISSPLSSSSIHHLSLAVPAVREVILMGRRRSIIFSLTPAPFSPY